MYITLSQYVHVFITLGGNEIIMHLLDDVRLIGSEILALPPIGTFKHSSTKLWTWLFLRTALL